MVDLSIETLFGLSEQGLKDRLEGLDAEAIADVMQEMQTYVDDLNTSRGVVADVYSAKMELLAAQRKIAQLSDSEKAALVQAIQADGLSGSRPVGE